MENMPSLADIAAVTRDDDRGFGGGWMWIIALFIIAGIFGGGAGFGFGNASRTDELVNAQFANLDRNVIAISNRQYEQANALTKGLCDMGVTLMTGHDAIRQDIANGMYQTSKAISEDGEKTRAMINGLNDRLYQNEINQLQAKVNQLQADIGNRNQNQFILGAMGQWRAYPPCNPYPCCAQGTVF